MKALYKLGLICLVALLGGCATTDVSFDNSTYSGAARAAVAKTANNASSYVRGLFSKPMPAWQPTVSDQSIVAAPVVVPVQADAKRDAADSVQTHPVDLGGR